MTTPDAPEQLGGPIYRRRIELGMTRLDVSVLTGLDASSLYKMERRTHRPRRATLILLGAALNCAPEDLMDE